MNFKEYIDKDIEEKKILLDLLPMNTEARVRKYKETVDEIVKNYKNILSSVREYVNYKYAKLYPNKIDRSAQIKKKDEEIELFKSLVMITNPKVSFYEKLGFDMLIFDLEHYYNNSLADNNEIIKKILISFKEAGITVSEKDFKINVFSYNYMVHLFQFISGKNVDIEIFKKIFWKCPGVYINIIICFRMLLLKYENKLNNYAKNRDNQLLKNNGLSNRDELIKKLYSLKLEKKQLEEKDESDIILDFINGDLDFSVYNNSVNNTYGELDYFLINPIDINNESVLNHTLNVIENFYNSLLEYQVMYSNNDLIDNIVNIYNKSVASVEKKQLIKDYNLQVKNISKMEAKAKKLMINKSFSSENIDKVFTPTEFNQCIEQQNILNEIYKEYANLDNQYFNIVLKNMIDANSFVSVVIGVVVFYPFFSRSIIKNVFELETVDEVNEKYNQLFDLYYNPYRKLIDMKLLFSKENFEQRLMDSYRFDNLNVNETTYEEDNQNLIIINHEKLINKIKISKFSHTIDEIEFLVEVSKIKDSEKEAG